MTGETPASTLKPWKMTPKSLIFRSESAGFSLVELLIVVTVIGIIASMAIPNLLRSKAAANEAVAKLHAKLDCCSRALSYEARLLC